MSTTANRATGGGALRSGYLLADLVERCLVYMAVMPPPPALAARRRTYDAGDVQLTVGFDSGDAG